MIKKIIFPFRLISQQEKIITDLNKDIAQQEVNISKIPLFEIELDFKESLQEIKISKLEDVKLSNDLMMSNYVFDNGFFTEFLVKSPGYLDFHKNNLIVLSSRGVLAYNENIEGEKTLNKLKITSMTL